MFWVLVLLVPFFAHANESEIIRLQEQIQQLMAEIAAVQLELQVAESHKPPPSATCVPLTRTLALGSVGNDVRQLQRVLMRMGDLDILEPTAYFGPQTEAAIRRLQCREFQLCAGDRAAGYGTVGPRTRARVHELCKAGTVLRAEDPVAEDTLESEPVCGRVCAGECGAAKTYANSAVLNAAGATRLHGGACTCDDPGIVCQSSEMRACTFWGRTVAHGQSAAAFREALVPALSLCESESRLCENGELRGSFGYPTCVVYR